MSSFVPHFSSLLLFLLCVRFIEVLKDLDQWPSVWGGLPPKVTSGMSEGTFGYHSSGGVLLAPSG